MFETPLTVVGTIVTNPVRHRIGDQELIKFRVASNSRRRTAEGNWEHGNSLFVTVNCWGRLVTGVGAAFGKGDAVIVVGHVYTSEYEDRDGVRRSSMEVRATSVGPDLARCIVRIERRGHPSSESIAGPATPDTAEQSADEADQPDADGGVDDQSSPEGLPLSA